MNKEVEAFIKKQVGQEVSEAVKRVLECDLRPFFEQPKYAQQIWTGDSLGPRLSEEALRPLQKALRRDRKRRWS